MLQEDSFTTIVDHFVDRKPCYHSGVLIEAGETEYMQYALLYSAGQLGAFLHVCKALGPTILIGVNEKIDLSCLDSEQELTRDMVMGVILAVLAKKTGCEDNEEKLQKLMKEYDWEKNHYTTLMVGPIVREPIIGLMPENNVKNLLKNCERPLHTERQVH